MFTEKRNGPRVNTHIVTELSLTEDSFRMCGYIENLSENGMGILSLENFAPGTQVITSFFLPGTAKRISTKAIVVNSNQKVCNLNYYSVRFENIDKLDREAIADFVHGNKQLLKNPA